jgi:multidrug efflux pump subunit AcrB|tara:strand:- start:10654 stop:13845 length:3192 start_codon:yes stop_codon:yes gene_type:complete
MQKNLANLFFQNPRLTILSVLFILIAGIAAVINLGRQEDPSMTERYGVVKTLLPGASASRVESLISEKIETALKEIPEIKELESTSYTGSSIVVIELYEHITSDEVELYWSEVRDKIADVGALLPREASSPELTIKQLSAVTVAFAIKGGNTPLSLLTRIAEELKYRLSNLPGTRETEIHGELEEEIHVGVDPLVLSRINFSIAELTAFIGASDTRTSAGKLENKNSSLVVEVKGELDSVERIRSIPIIRQNSASSSFQSRQFLRIGDIADVSKHPVDPPASMAIIDGERAVVVSTTMETGNRIDKWSSWAKDIADGYQSELPEMIQIEVILDQNEYTSDRLKSLMNNLIFAISIVLVALFFLMGIRSALIVGAALPLTIAMVLSSLSLMDIPLHQVSVTGLIISLGLLIDNAIVVVEEFKLKRRRGSNLSEAISKSVRHLFVPLLASTLTTTFAFLPIAMTPGGVGDFTGAMAVSVVLSISSSFLLAMTVIPSIAGFIDYKFQAPLQGASAKKSWWIDGYQNAWLSTYYKRSIIWVLKNPMAGVGLALILPVIGFLMSTTLPKAFFPPVDRNQFQVQISNASLTSIEETERSVQRAREILSEWDEIVDSHWFVGEAAPSVYYNMMSSESSRSHFANGFVNTRHVDDPRKILQEVQKRLMAEFPDSRIMAMPFEQGPPFSAPIELRLLGPDLTTLKKVGDQLRLILSQTTDVTYSDSVLSDSAPQVSIYPNENMVGLLGLSNSDIPRQLNSDLAGIRAGSVMEGTVEIPIRVLNSNNKAVSVSEIGALPLIGRSPGNGYTGIPIEQVAEISLEPGTSVIQRYQGEHTNSVSGFLLPYAYPSVALKDFKERFSAAEIELPSGYRLEFGGEEEERSDAISKMVATFVLFVWMMIAVVVLALNSFRYAAVIGAVGFLSVGLALFGVWLSGYPMGFMAIIGTLGLIGLAINGAIIVLSSLKESPLARAADINETADIVMDASRHIISTTITTIGGFLPLILFGGHFWPPLAMAIAGGVAGSAILSLYMVPALFMFFARRDMGRIDVNPTALVDFHRMEAPESLGLSS